MTNQTHVKECWKSYCLLTGVVLQTFSPPPEGLQPCRPPPEDLPKGEGLQHCRSSSFHCRSSPGEDLQHCRPSPIFVKFRILNFGYIEKRILNLNQRLYMQYLTFNDKTSIFSYVNDGYFLIKLRQLIWIYKDTTYNGWNGIGGRSAMGEGVQWFFNTIADLPGGGLLGGGGSLQITPAWYQTCQKDEWRTFILS